MSASDIFFGTSGPRDAQIMIVGEAWGETEDREQRPFAGWSGKELDLMLSEAGIDRAQCFCTNMISKRPMNNDIWRFFYSNQEAKEKKLVAYRGLFPQSVVMQGLETLERQIEAIKPTVIIAAGNYPLWALVGCGGISSFSPKGMRGTTYKEPTGIISWRGSMLEERGRKILPVIHPAGIMRAWYQRAITVHDLKTRVPQALGSDWRPQAPATLFAPPTFEEAKTIFNAWLQRLGRGEQIRISHDIETFKGLITSHAFGTGTMDGGFAMCIPLVRPTPEGLRSYWSHNEEVELARLIQKALIHPNILVEGQNYLYDTQYVQYYYGCTPRLDFDTMLAQHLLFPGTPKDLSYLSSVYCRHHWYWKEDLKEWDQKANFELNLRYNCVDVLRTYEVASEQRVLIPQLGMGELWEWMKKKNDLALRVMNRGILIDKKVRADMAARILEEQVKLAHWFRSIIPQSLVADLTKSKKEWFESVDQQKKLFYGVFGWPLHKNKDTGAPTVDDEALMKLMKKLPEFTRLFEALQTWRSCGVFRNNFLHAEIDMDDRMRCFVNSGGAKTFRWSTKENAFNRGTNLQNIPAGDEE